MRRRNKVPMQNFGIGLSRKCPRARGVGSDLPERGSTTRWVVRDHAGHSHENDVETNRPIILRDLNPHPHPLSLWGPGSPPACDAARTPPSFSQTTKFIPASAPTTVTFSAKVSLKVAAGSATLSVSAGARRRMPLIGTAGTGGRTFRRPGTPGTAHVSAALLVDGDRDHVRPRRKECSAREALA